GCCDSFPDIITSAPNPSKRAALSPGQGGEGDEKRLLGAGRTGAAGDAVGAEGVPDAAGVRRAVGQVAVVVVRRQVDRVPVGGGAAVHHGGRVALAARGDAVGALGGREALVPDRVHLAPAGGGAPAADQVLGEIPVRGAGDHAFAVALVTHRALVGADEDELVVRAGVAVAVEAGVVGHVRRLGDDRAAADREVGHVAHAGAGGAVVAVHARLEVLADAGLLGLEEGEGVADRLARALVAGGAAGVGVH